MTTVLRKSRSLRVFVLSLSALLVLGIFAVTSADAIGDAVRALRPAPRNPVAAAAADLFTQQRIQLRALDEQIRAATDPDEVRELQRKYQQVKLQTELDLLELQLEHARSRGDAALIAKLEHSVIGMRRLVENPDDLPEDAAMR